MKRRDLLVASGALLAAPLASFAQQPAKVWRIGLLVPSLPELNPGEPDPYAEAFTREMKASGHKMFADYVISVRSAAGEYERLPELARELLTLKADIIVPVTPVAISAAYQASKAIPIVCIGVHEPVRMGLASSLARPGGNLTGLATFYAELIPKHLELLKAIVPNASRVAALAFAATLLDPVAVKKVRDAAQKLGMRIQIVSIDSIDQLARAFADMTRERADAFITVADPAFARERRQLAELALKHQLPSFFPNRENVSVGGFLSYGEDFVDLFSQAAQYVSKIMKGAKPGDLPIEQPKKFHLAINLRTARTLKLSIPQELLLRADEVIE